MAFSVAKWSDKNDTIFTISPSITEEEQHTFKLPPNTLSAQETATLIYQVFFQSRSNKSSELDNNNTSAIKSLFSSIFGSSRKDEENWGNKSTMKSLKIPSVHPGEKMQGNNSLFVSIKTDSIPQQIHSMVRFHYASYVRFADKIPFSRTHATIDKNESSSKACGVIGIGVFAEFLHDGSVNTGLTSDRNGLLKYFSSYIRKDKSRITETIGLSHLRIASIGNHCRCVSWGFDYGIIRVYRRLQNHSQRQNGLPVAWKLVAIITPAPDLSTQNFNLVVTDLSPIIFDEHCALLSISRVGSLIQIIPIPNPFWNASTNNKIETANVMRIEAHGKPSQYGGFAHVNHEVLSIDVYKKNDSNANTFILAAAGASIQNKNSIVSFWGAQIHRKKQSSMPIIQVRFISEIHLSNTGPDIGTFLSSHNQNENDMKSQCSLVYVQSPILQISFSPDTHKSSNDNDLLLAVLDFHGGVSIISCEALLEVLEIDCQSKEFSSLAMPYVKINRTELFKRYNPSKYLVESISANNIAQILWFVRQPKPPRSESSSNDSQILSIVTLSQHGLIQITDLFTKTGKPKQIFQYQPSFPASSKEYGVGTNTNGTIVLLQNMNETPSIIDYVHINGRIDYATSRSVPFALCYIQKVDPPSIVKHLMKKKKYRQALNMALEYNIEVDPCYIAMWEDFMSTKINESNNEPDSVSFLNRVLHVLCRIRDNEYVINVALTIHQTIGDVECCSDALTTIFCEAITRAKQASVHAYQIGNKIPKSHSNSSLRMLQCWFNRLQTYIKLCSIWSISFDAQYFLSVFRDVPIIEVAKECAIEGDIDVLLLLFARHGNDLVPHRIHILDLLPPTLSPKTYRILLPVPNSHKGQNLFFIDKNHVVTISGLIDFFRETYPSYFLEKDEIQMIETVNDLMDSEENLLSIANWYIHKAHQIHVLTGNLSFTLELCNSALDRLNIKEASDIVAQTPGVISVIESIRSLRAISHHISRFFSDDLLSSEYKMMGIFQFMNLGLEKVVRIILGTHTNSFEVFSRFKRYIQPMVSGQYAMNGWIVDKNCDMSDGGLRNDLGADFKIEIRDSIISYGLSRVTQGCNDAEIFVNALSICLSFINSSRTVISPEIRFIEDVEIFMKFVLDCVYVDTSDIMDKIQLDQYTDILWELYECLPVRCEPENTSPNFNNLQDSVDQMRSHLIALDISSKYCAMPPSLFLMRATQEQSLKGLGKFRNEDSYTNLGHNIFCRMCEGFCGSIIGYGRLSSSERKKLAINFLSDAIELRKHVFPTLPLENLIETRVVQPLLRYHEFDIIKNILFFVTRELIDESLKMDNLRIKSAIFDFIHELYNRSIVAEVDVTGFGQSDLDVVRKCEESFGDIFPEWKQDFDLERRLVETLECIQRLQCYTINLFSLRNVMPFEIIEQVLSTNPFSIVADTDWGNEDASSSLNMEMIKNFNKDGSQSKFCIDMKNKMCIGEFSMIPPGGHLKKLCEMLGISSNLDVYHLHLRMIHHAINAKLFGAAVCMCYCLLMNCSNQQRSKNDFEGDKRCVLSLELLHNVSKLLKSYKTANNFVLKELCHASLTYSRSNFVTKQGYTYLSLILEYFCSMELDNDITKPEAISRIDENNSRYIVEHNNYSSNEEGIAYLGNDLIESKHAYSQKSDFLVFKAAGIFANRAKTVVGQVGKHHTSLDYSPESNAAPSFSQVPRSNFSVMHEFNSLRSIVLKGSLSENAAREFFSTKEVLSKTMAEKVLHESLIQSTLIRKPTHLLTVEDQSIIPPNDVLKLIQLGIALLLDTNDKKYIQALVSELKQSVEEKSAISLQQLAEEVPLTPVVPDEAIVRSLCAYGYESNGARRSVIMTNNSGLNEALKWAVAHFQDRNFNLPIVSLQDKYADASSKGGFVDQVLLHTYQQSLNLIMCVQNGGKLFKKRKKESFASKETISHKSASICDDTELTSRRVAPPIDVAKMKDTDKDLTSPKITSKYAKLDESRIEYQGKSSFKPVAKSLKGTSSKANLTSKLSSTPTNQKSLESHANEDILGSVRTSSQRKILRKKGEMLAKAGLGSKHLGSEERKRLLEEGRRAFEKARGPRRTSNLQMLKSSDDTIAKTKLKKNELTSSFKNSDISTTSKVDTGNSEVFQSGVIAASNGNDQIFVAEPSNEEVSDDSNDIGDGWDFDDF